MISECCSTSHFNNGKIAVVAVYIGRLHKIYVNRCLSSSSICYVVYIKEGLIWL